ncbi:MAG: hypothetical protein IPH07_16390 [Deltaproteobacteria bacterium]|nr:hypothetical protein [Deltaproteobacteria bacterium]MBP7291501.1 hypothetical protein [Nannocystaceae bacterium]
MHAAAPDLPKLIEGRFRPPLVTRMVRPIPMAGRGRCRIDPVWLHVEGRRGSSVLPTLAFVVLLVAAVLAVLALANHFHRTVEPRALGGLIAVLALSLGRIVRPRATRTPLVLAIPWSSIAAVAAEGRRGVVIHVRAFAPAGTLHFEPAANVDRHALLAALADHVDRARAPEAITTVRTAVTYGR